MGRPSGLKSGLREAPLSTLPRADFLQDGGAMRTLQVPDDTAGARHLPVTGPFGRQRPGDAARPSLHEPADREGGAPGFLRNLPVS